MNGFMADAPSPGSATTSSTNLKDENGLSPVVTTTSLPTEKFESQTASDDDIALAPVDGGRAAWMFMVGAVIVDAVIGGFPLNFGVFQDFYMTHPPFQDNRLIPMIGTFATGISYLGGPLVTPVTIRYHTYRRHMVLGGAAACVLGNIGASFATKIWTLVLCQGVIYGIGFLVMSYSVFSMLNEWFVKRRGLAYGILLSAADAGGLGLPFILQVLLENYGYAMTLRIYSIATVVIIAPALLLLRSRTRHLTTSPPRSKINYSILKKPIFTNLSICNFLQGLVFYLPGIFIPSFAADILVTPTHRSALLVLLNLSQILGLLTIGHVSDTISIYPLLFVSSFFSALVTFTLWGLSKSLLSLCFFTFIYGFLAGSFESLFPRFAMALTDDPAAELTFYGLFEFERGLGMVLAGPISGALIGKVVDVSAYGLVRYQDIVLFVGSALFVSSLAGAGWHFRDRKWYT